MSNQQQQHYYTNLAGVKWTKSSLIKTLDMLWSQGLKNILNHPYFSKEEKNKRIDFILKEFLSIYEPIMEYGVTVKKQ